MEIYARFFRQAVSMVGLGLIVFEAAFRAKGPDPALIALYVTLLGSPFAYRADEVRREKKRKENGNEVIV